MGAGRGGFGGQAVEDGLGFLLVVAGDFGDGEAGVDHDVVAGVEGVEEGGADGALGAVGADEGGGVVDGEDFGGDADTHCGSSFLFVVAKVGSWAGRAGALRGLARRRIFPRDFMGFEGTRDGCFQLGFVVFFGAARMFTASLAVAKSPSS